MVQATKPPETSENPYLPPGFEPLVFDTFNGINTDASRPGIQDDQMYWCDGFMPLGKNNLRTLPGIGPALFAVDSVNPAATVVWAQCGNIDATPYAVILLSDGSIIAQNTNTKAGVFIVPPGTVLNPALNQIDLTQWGSKYLAIVVNQTNGLFIWDGTATYASGSLGPDITVTNGGLDYTGSPLITVRGGSGSGATVVATVKNGSIETISVTNPGSGYGVNDQVQLVFSGGGNPGSTAVGVASVSGGSVTGVSMVAVGAGYTSTTSVSFVGGGGFDAAGVPTPVPGNTIGGVSITNGGQGYTSAPTVLFSDGNSTLAQATVDMMPFGESGTTIQTYQSRLWIGSVARIDFTAPDDLTDFDPGDGAGDFTSNDNFLRVGFSKLIQTNGFLYLIADSSINYLSGVQTSGNPPTTTFTNQNADPEIGTPFGTTVQVFSRNIIFANAFGVHVSYGGAVTKVSTALDGVFNTVPNFGGFQMSSAKAIIFGKRVFMVLVPVIDFITGQQVNKLFMWNGKDWWSSQQDVPLIYVFSQEINSVLTAYGTDGKVIYPLFQVPSVGFTKVVQSKLWDRPDSYLAVKTAQRIWGLAYYYSELAPQLTVGVDSETSTAEYEIALQPGMVAFVNASGTPVVFLNGSGQPVLLLGTSGGGSTGIVVFPPTAVGQQGVLTGLTISTDAADMALISMIVATGVWEYRG